MPASVAASFSTNPVAAAAGVSKTKESTYSVQASGVLNADLATLTVAFGKAAARPGTYAALANPVENPITLGGWDKLQATTPDGGLTWNVNFTVLSGVNGNAAWAPGDHVWLALFNVSPPIAGSVPIATAGPYIVIA